MISKRSSGTKQMLERLIDVCRVLFGRFLFAVCIVALQKRDTPKKKNAQHKWQVNFMLGFGQHHKFRDVCNFVFYMSALAIDLINRCEGES